MGVNWQNNEMYKYAKDFYKETGIPIGTAQYGETHSVGGVIGLSLFTGLANKFTEGLGGSQDTGSATDVTGNTSSIREFTKAKKNYDRASGEDKIKYAKELQKLGEANPDNPTISKIYNNTLKNELNGIINKK